jgi:hypothetical protein
VDKFCKAIASAGVRDRFFRLNLFCGSFQGAFVPLFRGPSLGGTQYGGATDTNLGGLFVSGDYNETGASGGLLGNVATGKALDTGLAANALPSFATGHLAAYKSAGSVTGQQVLIGARNPTTTDLFRIAKNTGTNGTMEGHWGTLNSVTAAVGSGNDSARHVVISRTGNLLLKLYRDGVVSGTLTTSSAPSSIATNWTVFAEQGAGAIFQYFALRLQAYSIGASMDDAQVAAYNTAMLAFQTSLSRT